MYTFFALGVLGLIVGILRSRAALKKRRDSDDAILISGGYTFIGMIIGGLAAFVIGWANPLVKVVEEKELVAFNDRNSVEGSLFLGTGRIDSMPIYVYYEKSSSDHIKQGRVPVDSSWIKEEDREDGVLRIHRMEPKPGSENFGIYKLPGISYVFHVPTGTVIRQFVADLN